MLEEKAISQIERAAGGNGRTGQRLDSLTTLGCGGPASLLIEAHDSRHLAELLETARNLNIPWFILGRGSNVLVADEGWDGIVITLGGEFRECGVQGEKQICGGAVTLPRAASNAAAAGLSGLEPLAYIPGTIGGALAMNAGAHGTSIGDLVVEAQLSLPGETRTVKAGELNFKYRESMLPEGSIVGKVVLQLSQGDPETITGKMAELRAQRESVQPLREKTCGSVFKNPPGNKSAGQLLDEAGCKGLVNGGAAVSETHANFIINRGNATAGDVIGLMNRCRRMVKDSAGVVLEPEVKFLGDIRLDSL